MCFENIKPSEIEYPKFDSDGDAIHETSVELSRKSVDFKMPIQHLASKNIYDAGLWFMLFDGEFLGMFKISNDGKTAQEFKLGLKRNDMYALYMFLHNQLHEPFAKYLQEKAAELCCSNKTLTTEDIKKIIDDWRDEE